MNYATNLFKSSSLFLPHLNFYNISLTNLKSFMRWWTITWHSTNTNIDNNDKEKEKQVLKA